MITNAEKLERLEAEFARRHYDRLTFAEALDRYAAMWALARAIRPADEDWLEDLEPDLAVARAVNGLPPAG